MNPLKWVRWKVLAALFVIWGALYFLGLNPLARREINKLGSTGQAGARFSVEQVALGLLAGRSSFHLFQVATPREPRPGEEARERVASAEEIVCDLGMGDLLRRRFAVDELSVKRPLLRVERRPDGTINVGEIGSTEPEPPAGKPVDWVKALGEWMQRIRKRVEERRKREAEEKQEPEVARKKEKGLRADYSRRVTYPFEKVPRAVVRKLKAEALEIQFEDQAGGLKPPPIRNARVEILNLSDRPEHYPDPIQISIAGEIEGAPVEVSGTIDLRLIPDTDLRKNDLLLKVKAHGIPLRSVVQAFAGGSIEATFEKGTAELDADLSLVDLERIAVRSPSPDRPLFALRGVEMKAKPGSKIAGFDGDRFCRAVNEVGELEIRDLEITGTLADPEFRWGKSIENLVVSGVSTVAKRKAGEALEKGTAKAQEAIHRELGDKAPDLKGLEKALPKALDGIFGKKKAEAKPEAPKTP